MHGRAARCWPCPAVRGMGVRSPSGKEYWGGATIRGIPEQSHITGTIYANARAYGRPVSAARPLIPSARPRIAGHRYHDQWVAIATIPAIVTANCSNRVQAKIATNRSFAREEQHATDYRCGRWSAAGRVAWRAKARRTLQRKDLLHCTGKDLQVRRGRGHLRVPIHPGSDARRIGVVRLADLLRRPTASPRLCAGGGGCWCRRSCGRARRTCNGSHQPEAANRAATEAYLSGVVPLAEYSRRRVDWSGGCIAGAQQEQLSGEASRASEVAVW